MTILINTLVLCTNVGTIFLLDLYPVHRVEHLWGIGNSLVKVDVLASNYTYEDYCRCKDNIAMGKIDGNSNTFALNQMIMRNIKSIYKPGKHVALDEMLRKFFGRYEFKHRIPSKPAKEGLKTFLIACSRLRIPFDFVFHDNKMPSTPGLSVIAGMVFAILKSNREDGYLQEGTTIFLDNYFTTQGLFKKMFRYWNICCQHSENKCNSYRSIQAI